MNNKIEYMEYITRDYIRENQNKIFLFGDNLVRKGYGGQAREMRGEPNSIGIVTKRVPAQYPKAYIYDTDNDIEDIKKIIDNDFASIPNNIVVVVPYDGLGSGLARLNETAPLLFKYIKNKIEQLMEK